MRTERIKFLNSFIKNLTEQAQDNPDDYFTIPLNGLMWSFISLKATFQPPIDIKVGLLQFIGKYSDVLHPPSRRKHASTAGFISEPTRKKYIDKAKDGNWDYNKLAFDKFLKITMSAGFKEGLDFSGFWESFAKKFMRFELYPMLPPHEVRAGTDPFWIGKNRKGPTIMVNVNLFHFCTIFGKVLHQAGKDVFDPDNTSFDFYNFLVLSDKLIKSTLLKSPVKLMFKMRGMIVQ